MYRHLPKPDQTIEPPRSLSFILTSTGLPVLLQSCLSSIPRSDLSLFLARHSPGKTNLLGKKLKSLPITPYPVPAGHKVGVHLFSGLNDGEPVVKLNKRHSLVDGDNQGTERMQRTSSWIGGRAYKRWGVGEMLGYRSYTGQEVEVCTSQSHNSRRNTDAKFHFGFVQGRFFPHASSPANLASAYVWIVRWADHQVGYWHGRRSYIRKADG